MLSILFHFHSFYNMCCMYCDKFTLVKIPKEIMLRLIQKRLLFHTDTLTKWYRSIVISDCQFKTLKKKSLSRWILAQLYSTLSLLWLVCLFSGDITTTTTTNCQEDDWNLKLTISWNSWVFSMPLIINKFVSNFYMAKNQ